jgi:hypothetical protein
MHRSAPFWLAAFPTNLLVGVFTIPVVADYADHELAAAAVDSTLRWYVGHLISALAFAVAAIAAMALWSRLAQVERGRGGAWAAALVVIGACCHVFGLGADGVGPIATGVGGGAPQMYFDGLGVQLVAVFVTGAAAFALGWIGLIRMLVAARIVRGWRRWWLPVGVVLMAAAEAIPSGWGLYLVATLAATVWLPISNSLATASDT